ncbi:MAG: ComEC/Rec2 family competence protein [Elusimicrobia bacterium]|nr:ComEC/Rec2 family competence protein [Elusimicrobiota bacterium]
MTGGLFKKKTIARGIFLAGLLLLSSANYIYKTNPGPGDISQITPFTGTARGKIKLPVRSTLLEIKEVDLGEDTLQASGRVMVFLKESDEKPPPGAYVSITGRFLPPPGKRNPAALDIARYLKTKGAFTVCYPEEINVIRNDGIAGIIGKSREYIAKTADNYMGEEEAGILKGMLLGMPGEVKKETLASFRYAGITHILAVSGLHVGLVMYIFYIIFYILRIKEKYSYLISIFVMASYITIAGARPSAMRAGVMFAMLFAGKLTGGRGNIYNNLFFAVIALLVINPALLYDPGFQLSFLAVFGIVYLSPVFSGYLGRPLAVSLAAVAAIVPVITWNFYYLPLLSPITNLLVVPLAGLAVSLGFVFLLVASFSGFLAQIYAVSAGYAITGIAQTAKLVKDYSAGGFYTGKFSFLVIFGFYVFLIGIGVKKKRNRRILIIAGLLFTAIGITKEVIKKDSFITAISGKDGVCFLVRPDNSETVLFAGTKDINARAAKNYLYSKGITKVNDIYLIHPSYGKLERVAGFAGSFKTINIYCPGITGNPLRWEKFKASLENVRLKKVFHKDIFRYSNFRINITEPKHKYLDIRDNYIQAGIEAPSAIFIYAGGGIPGKKYDYTIAVEPFSPEWQKLKERTSKKIIASGVTNPPGHVELIGEKGKIFQLP